MQGNSKDAGVAELGRINCEYSLQIESMDELIWEDNRELEKAYFDPFVKDKNAIKASLSKIEGALKIKGDELEEKQKQLDERNDALRSLAMDLADLRKEHDGLINENEELNKKLKAL